MRNKRVAFFIGLLLCQGVLNFSHAPTLKYNVLKDSGFESGSEIWKEIVLPLGDTSACANRHSMDPTTPDPEYVGITSAGGSVLAYAILRQEFIPRVVSDFDLDSSLVFWVKWHPHPDGAYEWGIKIFGGQGDTLTFKNPGKQDTWTHINLGNIYELWIRRGLPETDSLYAIELWAHGHKILVPGDHGPIVLFLGESVSWDLVCLYSKRPDLDAEMVSIDSPDRLEEGYEPITTVKNSGALAISFPVICDISQDGEVIYSDTSQIDSLKPDSSIQITFKPYSGSISSTTYSLKFYALLEGDQNPANDTLKKTLTTTGISEKPLKTSTIQLSISSNPAKGIVDIRYEIPDRSPAELKIYDASGRLVRTLVKNQSLGSKICTTSWDGRDDNGRLLPPGVYFCKLEIGGYRVIKRLILIR